VSAALWALLERVERADDATRAPIGTNGIGTSAIGTKAAVFCVDPPFSAARRRAPVAAHSRPRTMVRACAACGRARRRKKGKRF
jgi:hypothetical protein